MKKPFDASAWSIQFDRVFVVAEFWNDFGRFAKLSHVDEMLSFCEEYRSCENLMDEKLDAAVRHIVDL
jgi:hypothetical protein